jgi:hypothetical protein
MCVRIQPNTIFSYVDAVNAASRDADTGKNTYAHVNTVHTAYRSNKSPATAYSATAYSATAYSATAYHCKVCADSGKPASVVSSHNVKSINGTVTCPTLLAMNCRYCKLPGHTVKFCATLIKQNANATNTTNTTTNSSSRTKLTKAVRNNDCKNTFSAFCDSDGDSDKEEVVAATVPIKPKPITIKNKPTNSTSKWVAAEFEDSSDEEDEDA